MAELVKTTPWSPPIVIAVSIAVAAAGFVLVVAEIRPQINVNTTGAKKAS
jgi:hypothetical protein